MQYNEVANFMVPVEKKEQELSAPEISSHHSFDDGERSGLLEPLILLAKHKFFVLYFVAGAALLSAAIAMLLPQYYTANAKIMPPQQNQSMASAMLNQLGQLGPLIGAGKDLGIHNPSDLYISMLRSRPVADDIVDHFSLMSAYDKKLRVDARQVLDDRTAISSGKDGIISISVDDHSPTKAAEMANAYVEELEKLTRTLAVTDAGKRRLFFEGEVKSANDELATAEQSLKSTEENTGIIQLDSQSKVMLQTYADLRAQIGEKEVQLQSMRSFATPENPDLMRAEQELNALRGQLAHFERGQNGKSSVDLALEKVPGAGLEYVRKLREVKYRETLFELLAKQYEAARMDEARDASVVQVLERAMPPEKRSWPRRGLIVELATLLALLLTIPVLHIREALRRVREEPQTAPRWQLLKMYLRSGRRPFPGIMR